MHVYGAKIVFVISFLLQPLANFCAPVIPPLAITCFFSCDTQPHNTLHITHYTFYCQNTTDKCFPLNSEKQQRQP